MRPTTTVATTLSTALLLSLVMVPACSTGDAPVQGVSPGGSDPAAVQGARAAVFTTARTVSTLPMFRDMFVQGAVGWRAQGQQFLSPAAHAPVAGALDQITGSMALRATESLEISYGPNSASRLVVRREAVRDVAGEVVSGHVVFPEAFPSTDIVVTATSSRIEEFLLLHDDAAPRHFSWAIDMPRDGGEVKTKPEGLEFTDAGGFAWIRVPRPVMVDADGRTRTASLTWDGAAMHVEAELEGLAFPVVVDPAFDSILWEAMSPTTPPTGRSLHAAAYDSVRHRLVVFGGTTDVGDQGVDEVCEYSGTAWSCPVPATRPSARRGASMAYDSKTPMTLMFGGVDTASLDDDGLWGWNGATWAKQCAAAPCSTNPRPTARRYVAMAYDSSRSVVVLFGGLAGSTAQGDTWEWTGSAWNLRCGSTGPACAVSARYMSGMAFDSANNVSVLVGGYTTADTNEIWEWNGTTWTQQCTSVACQGNRPVARRAPVVAYDTNRNRVIMFSGFAPASGGARSDTWEWNRAAQTWTQTSTGSPGPVTNFARYYSAGGFDTFRRRVVAFGGMTSTGRDATTLEYHGRGGDCTTGGAAVCDTFNCVDKVCCEVGSCGICQQCDGTAPAYGTCSAVKNLDDDTCTGNNTCDANGVCKLKNGRACTGPADCASGNCVDGLCCNQPCSGACDTCKQTLGASADGVCTLLADGHVGLPACGAYLCDGTNATCPSVCATDGDCSGTYYCSASNQCDARKSNGEQCNLTSGVFCKVDNCRMCTSSYCVDGHCCNETCTATCKSCSTGTCSTVTNATDAPQCSGAQTCNGTGQCGLVVGQPCTSSAQCAYGNCVDGVCCDGACAGGCDVCKATLGATKDGTCTPAAAGSVGANPSCSPYLCNGTASCPATCSGDSDCVSDHYCAANGQCTARKDRGATCNLAAGQNCMASGCRACKDTNCVDGRCCESTCDQPCQTCSASPGFCTSVTSAPDSPQCTGIQACDSAGACKKANGQSCGAGTECASGNCNTGVCCDKPCGGACDECKQSLGASADGVCTVVSQGSPGSPSCTPLQCDGNVPSCPGGCTNDQQCTSDRYCSAAGTCLTRKAQGTSCNAGQGQDCYVPGCRVCNTAGNCVDGVCCDQACSATCLTCAAALGASTDGTCAPIPQLGSDQAPLAAVCQATQACDGSGNCKKNLGQSCAGGVECASGNCADGVCCDTVCTAVCMACDVSQHEGHCWQVPAGESDDGDCADANAVPACTKACDGNGACVYAPDTTPCGSTDQKCTAGELQAPDHCSGTGQCQAGTKGSCDGHECANATTCLQQCTLDSDCVASYHCANNDCVPDLADGKQCQTNSECMDGNCVDGFCCESACDQGNCVYCALAGQEGKCLPVPVGQDPRHRCQAASGGSPSCAGSCGANGSCVFPGAEKTCALCTLCDGAGRCTGAATDDVACNSPSHQGIDCSGLDTQCLQHGDITAARCKGIGECKSASAQTCTSVTDVCDGGTSDSGKGGSGGGGNAGAGGSGGGATGGTGGAVASDGGQDAAGASAGSGGQSQAAESSDKGGCGCRTHDAPAPASSLVLLVTAVAGAMARRRRRHGRP